MHSYYSQPGIIIRGFQYMDIPLGVKFFQKGKYFVGYKASSRLCELVKEGLIERLLIDEIGSKGQHFALYQLTEAGKEYKIPKPTLFEQLKHFYEKI